MVCEFDHSTFRKYFFPFLHAYLSPSTCCYNKFRLSSHFSQLIIPPASIHSAFNAGFVERFPVCSIHLLQGVDTFLAFNTIFYFIFIFFKTLTRWTLGHLSPLLQGARGHRRYFRHLFTLNQLSVILDGMFSLHLCGQVG